MPLGKDGDAGACSLERVVRCLGGAGLRQVLDVTAQRYTRVLVLLPNGTGGSREARVGEGSDGDDGVRIPLPLVVNDGAAMRAEVKGGLAALLTHADVCGGSAADVDGVPGETGLGSEGAACAPLAIQAVADRNAHGCGGDCSRELAAATSGEARGHG